MEEESNLDTGIHEFDLDILEKADISDLRQEGNYLIGMTNTGIRFSQRIPANKILDKLDGKWVLKEIVHSS